LAEGFIPRGEM